MKIISFLEDGGTNQKDIKTSGIMGSETKAAATG
jgi:hypothetical protein